MYETTQLSISTKAEKLFKFVLSFYPELYRKQYEQEMFILFQDLYQEEIEKNGKIGVGFWVLQFGDMTKSIIQEHISFMQHQGVKKYLQQTFHINKFNVISGVFLLPVILMIFIEIISRIAQGDLTHYNRPVYSFLSHTFLYWTPVLFTWVILFPFIAALISFIPLVKAILKKKISVFSFAFLRKNVVTVGILLFGLGFIVLIKFHDFVPCMFYGVTHFGFGHLSHILSVCRNA